MLMAFGFDHARQTGLVELELAAPHTRGGWKAPGAATLAAQTKGGPPTGGLQSDLRPLHRLQRTLQPRPTGESLTAHRQAGP
ncbi:hypothetical protein C7C46_30990 [Streptomyces tateyamensis]|uniref:Uncharacterized protein n=1 Tax=Streptomyces tateyamensis TaxID=565073 RepID=A0A2V4NTJ9_9ACTN|nr:hypothetical protein C7C46_30990 [Streptomyces tateyamensis]